MSYLIGGWIGGALPIVFIAWLLRMLWRVSLTPRSAVFSVFGSAFIAFFLQNFGNGEGGFQNRIENLLSPNTLISVIPSAGIALVILMLVMWWSNTSKGEP